MLDEDDMWPASCANAHRSRTVDAKIAELVRTAVP